MTTTSDRVQERRCLYLLLLFSWVFFTLTDPGALGSIDATRRAQTTQWLWGAGPSTIPNDTIVQHDWVLPGRTGEDHYWYGIGQSLLMLPADVVFTTTMRVLGKQKPADDAAYHSLRRSFISITTFPITAALAVAGLMMLFRALGLGLRASVASAVVATFSTRLMLAGHNHQELGQNIALFIWAFVWLIRWKSSGRTRELFIASLLLGANLLFRLPMIMDIVIIGVVCLGWFWIVARDQFWPRTIQAVTVAGSTLLAFLVIDRLYHFYRFGEWTSTYLDIQARVVRAKQLAPPDFPWSTPFWEGMEIHFIGASSGVIWYDLMLLPTCYMVVRLRRHLPDALQFVFVATALMFLSECAFYARYIVPAGGVSWGGRYVATGAILMSALAAPLFAIGRDRLNVTERVAIVGFFVVSTVIQLSSIVFDPVLEFSEAQGSGGFLIGKRLVNISSYLFDIPPYDAQRFAAVNFGNFGVLNFGIPKILAQAAKSPVLQVAVTGAWLAAVLASVGAMLWLATSAFDRRRPPGREMFAR